MAYPEQIDGGDALVVGAGLAGLFTALKLAPERRVTVIAAAPLSEGASSAWAQGGVAAAMGEGDSADLHTADTEKVAGGIAAHKIVEILTRTAPDRIADLIELGVPFDRDPSGHLVFGREAAHSRNRIVRVQGDRAGKAIMGALVAAVAKRPSIRVIENMVAMELAVADGRVCGIHAAEAGGTTPVLIRAHATVLATGGIGGLFRVTTNPAVVRGEGLGMAARAGAVVADPEFVQFHPTAIDVGRDPAPLATEALRGEGAILVNERGERFMTAIHPDAELGPRDVVARGIFAELKRGGRVYLDTRQVLGARIETQFPTVAGYCREAGIDPVREPIPVAPAEHYHMGGILTDEYGRTSLAGLWAVGEVSSTGAHGANRLASNSLLESIVFGGRVAEDIARDAGETAGRRAAGIAPISGPMDWEAVAAHLPRLRETMTHDVGVVRDAAGLAHALRVIGEIEAATQSLPMLNVLATARLIAAGALARTESRGGHYRSDFPDTDAAFAHRTAMTLADARAHAQA
ncbi:MAG: L-aspartate oxidase [Alphaproteobacteria bacterium]|nr:L-aspartate oxidase [Alphaproteobacteria bacterium]MDX5367893.1 L-aspartate oxidase [Alphaproteobacteria bacterium]MDX5462761.1 L-aspartate oxidase [Alphaproteobacteria bacterium]